MRTRGENIWVVLGAVLGGMIVGTFPPEPRWLWGVGGGVAGALLGLLSAYLFSRPWPWPARALGVLAVFGGGFLLLFLGVGRLWITNPHNFNLHSP